MGSIHRGLAAEKSLPGPAVVGTWNVWKMGGVFLRFTTLDMTNMAIKHRERWEFERMEWCRLFCEHTHMRLSWFLSRNGVSIPAKLLISRWRSLRRIPGDSSPQYDHAGETNNIGDTPCKKCRSSFKNGIIGVKNTRFFCGSQRFQPLTPTWQNTAHARTIQRRSRTC